MNRLKNKSLLIIGLVWPEPKSSAAGTRMLQLIDLFQRQGFEIVFASAAQESEFSFDLKSIGVSTQKIALNSSSFDDFIAELNPEIVLFDRYVIEEQFGWRVYENSPNSLRILDTEDLHCLRLARQNAVKKNIDFQLSDLLSEPVAKREIASVLRCDLTLIISEFEMSVLNDIFKINSKLLYYLPLFYDTIEVDLLPKFDERKDFVFIGNFLHEPNWDAVKQLKEKIWPQIRKNLPEAKMNIYGAYPSQKVLQLHNPNEKFLIHGRAEDAEEVIKNTRILVAPLRFGAGLKGKLLEAMLFGTPSVTTSVGTEGISENEDWNGFMEDDFNGFASKSVLLYEDENLWNKMQGIGFHILENRFKKEGFENSFIENLNSIKTSLEAHRNLNFMGNLLLHHNALSTKYMSRWIEEKNK
ncbi:glycosyltransferase family 4 protein [Flavobacterium sp.]|uniref:glycosyltransferase family 4 protein n=1 Tax=Flavobacterium sp. TaxID=239 RepID=UPI0026216B3C|nr:glycosyltransferase family 4 protein [Flavobacterium sp.]